MGMKCIRIAVFALSASGYVLSGCATSAFAADQAVPEAEQETAGVAGDTASVKQETAVKWYQLQNVTIPPDCALRSQANITKPPSIFVEIKKNGKQIFQSSTEKGWNVDYPNKKHVFPVDDPEAVYTIQIWDDCWWSNQNICNLTGLRSDAFAKSVYQKGGQYDTKERLLSVEFKEVPAP
jgi:hypothetical protein